MLPHTSKRRTTTNLKTRNNQNCQKMKTVWKSDNQGVIEETLIKTNRRGGDWQPGRSGSTARWQLVDQVVPHLHADKLGGTTREKDRPRVPAQGNKASKTSGYKNL